MKTTMKNMVIATVTLLSSTAFISTAQEDKSKSNESKGKCYGVNSCKGQTACATAEGSCAGTNSCKGKGWLPMTKDECSDKKGRFEANDN